MQSSADEKTIQAVIDKLVAMGFDIHRSTGMERTVLGAIGKTAQVDEREITLLPGVAEVIRIKEEFKLSAKSFRDQTIVKIGDLEIGGPEVIIMAGPCAVESEAQLQAIAPIVKKAGGKVLRGGAFKPRTSPYAFQGLGLEGLKLLRKVADEHHLLVVTEIMDVADLPAFLEYVDIIQVGARNMQNFAMLKDLGKIRKPVLLKRGISATIKEWLLASEYLLAGGNYQVMLCERGIRTFETMTRNTLDLSAIPLLHKLTHLPIIADPSHGTGIRDHVMPMARAAVAAGADGLLIEIHNEPEKALSDGPQSLYLHQYEDMMEQLRIIGSAIGRKVEAPWIKPSLMFE
jgi:3-deoxy-7-phosphoheptulonate synthase